jgi:hypothetical protein
VLLAGNARAVERSTRASKILAADKLQQRHVGVALSVLLRGHCDSEPIGPLAESTSFS